MSFINLWWPGLNNWATVAVLRPPVGNAGPAALALLVGTYLFGLFQICTLPPFEGFDEPAHYSYIQEVALTGQWPHRGDPMSADIDAYLERAPAAAAINPVWSYSAFFAAPAAVLNAGQQAIHDPPPVAGSWRPGTITNWEAQHPPLYYALLAPAYRMAASWSFGARLLLLRGVSYSLACGGLCLAAYAAWRGADRRLPALAPALWPLLLPMWFPEMARLGNDSLVVLIAGIAALLLQRALRPNGGIASHLATGLALGFGLLTKALFLPLTLAAVGLLALRAWRGRRGYGGVTACLTALCLVAGWWYAGQALTTGNPIGSNDAINLAHDGGLLAGLRQHGSARAFLLLPGSFATSLAWVGTWSFVSPPRPWLVLLLLGWLPLIIASLRHGWRGPLTWFDRAAPLTLLLFLAGLLYQSLILIATVGSAAPAWYLHAFLPVLWPQLGWGLAGVARSRAGRMVLAAQLAYAPAFLIAAALADLLFYAGCPFQPGVSHFLDLQAAAALLTRPSVLFQHLQVVGFPVAGAGLFVAGILTLILGAALTMRLAIESRATTRASKGG